MNQLQTDNLIALSLLLDEEIYVFNDLPKHEVLLSAIEIATEVTAEIPKPITTPVVEIPKIEQPIAVIPKTQAILTVTIPQIEKPAVALKTKNDGFDYLGENNKYILIIVNNPNEKFLPKLDLAFLEKIMGSKKWILDDVAIVNMAKYQSLDFDDLKAFFACSKIITFGFNPTVLNIVGAVANQKSMYKNVAILGTWDLTKIQNDVAKKTVFWNQLKAL